MPLWVQVFVLQIQSDPWYSVWSNFEIADMEFWRSEAYQKFFDHLESKGGFYYEVISCLVRWTRPFVDTTTCSGGGTHQFTALLLLYLHQRIRYTFSVILDTATIPSNIVQLETSGPGDVVHAIPRTVLVSLIYVYARSSDLLLSQTMPLILVSSVLRSCLHRL